MIIQRTKYFADKKEEKKKKDYTTAKSAAKIAGGAGIAVGGGLLGDAIAKKGGDYLKKIRIESKRRWFNRKETSRSS